MVYALLRSTKVVKNLKACDNKDNFKLKIKIAKGVYNNTILTKEKIIAYVVLGIIGIGIIVFIPITVKRMKNKNKI